MADQKITQLTADTSPTSDDLVVTVNSPGGTPANRKVTLANLALGLGAAWGTWTPTLSGLFTDADWTKTGSCYIQIGKTVICQLHLVSADATPMGGAGGAVLTLPVTARSYEGTAGTQHVGQAIFRDADGAFYLGNVVWNSTTTAAIFASRSSNTYTDMLNPSSTVPFTWTTNDEIHSTFIYEAA